MRISDWSSDVYSSDLGLLPLKPRNVAISELHVGILVVSPTRLARLRGRIAAFVGQIVILLVHAIDLVFFLEILIVRSGELGNSGVGHEIQRWRVQQGRLIEYIFNGRS